MGKKMCDWSLLQTCLGSRNFGWLILRIDLTTIRQTFCPAASASAKSYLPILKKLAIFSQNGQHPVYNACKSCAAIGSLVNEETIFPHTLLIRHRAGNEELET